MLIYYFDWLTNKKDDTAQEGNPHLSLLNLLQILKINFVLTMSREHEEEPRKNL